MIIDFTSYVYEISVRYEQENESRLFYTIYSIQQFNFLLFNVFSEKSLKEQNAKAKEYKNSFKDILQKSDSG